MQGSHLHNVVWIWDDLYGYFSGFLVIHICFIHWLLLFGITVYDLAADCYIDVGDIWVLFGIIVSCPFSDMGLLLT